MKTLQGLGISTGIAIGKIFLYRKEVVAVEKHGVQDPLLEVARLASALSAAKIDLEDLQAKAACEAGSSEAGIFEAQRMMLEDPTLIEQVEETIQKQMCSADYAWFQGTEYYANLLGAMEDEYLAARSGDVRDMAQRVLIILAGKTTPAAVLEQPVVIVAQELTPSDTVSFDKQKVLAFCTAQGGPTSHVAILSKALGIPAVTGIEAGMDELWDGRVVIVDGSAGLIFLDPDEDTCVKYLEKAEGEAAAFTSAVALAHEPGITRDGRRVEVAANIGSKADALAALTHGADGAGLLRTEFLFLDRDDQPTEAEQYQAYREILDAFENRPVVARTLDIGGDKPVPYLRPAKELNPFLGVRGVRLALANPKLFQTQLRALLRAGVDRNLKIMFPMVSSLSELFSIHKNLSSARSSLEEQGQDYAREIEIGIMVEIPSVALMADVFAQHVDFFSIGTNDLSQYTLASDRTNPNVAQLADALDPSILRLIKMVVSAAHSNRLWVGLCGELAGDSLAVPVLLGLGIDEFSMNPLAIPLVKSAIRQFSMSEASEIAKHALELSTAREVREYLRNCSPSAIETAVTADLG